MLDRFKSKVGINAAKPHSDALAQKSGSAADAAVRAKNARTISTPAGMPVSLQSKSQRTGPKPPEPRAPLGKLPESFRSLFSQNSMPTLLDLPRIPVSSDQELAADGARWHGKVKLSWKSSETVSPQEALLARRLVTKMLDGDAATHVAPSSEAMKLIDKSKRIASSEVLTPSVMRSLSENMFRAQMLHQQKTSGNFEAPKVPTECIAAWLEKLDSGLAKAGSQPHGELLQQLKEEARAQWMSHDLSIGACKDVLRKAAALCIEAQQPVLANQASDLVRELDKHTGASPELTRLHDNLNGRAWESFFIKYLVQNVPPPVLESTHAVASYLAKQVSEIPESMTEELCTALKSKFSERARWCESRPEIDKLRNFPSARKDFCAELQKILNEQPRNGADVVALQMLCFSVSMSLEQVKPDLVPWGKQGRQVYGSDIRLARSRRTEISGTIDAAAAGVTLRYQPHAITMQSMSERRRPGDEYSPNFEKLSNGTRKQMESGIPYVSDVSGTTNHMRFLVDHAKANGVAIDRDHAMLGTIMAVGYDGGHSLHECLWTLDLINARSGEDRKYTRESEDAHVSNYDAYIDSFVDDKVKNSLMAAADSAFNNLTEYRRQHLGNNDS